MHCKTFRISIAILSLILSSNILLAQEGSSDPNETWNLGNYGEAFGWISSNDVSINKLGLATVSEVQGIVGSGVRMQTLIKGKDTVLGMISNTRGAILNGEGGLPFPYKPVGMHGYYRYHLADDDTAMLLLVFKRQDTIINKITYKIKGQQATYTPFTFPISLDKTPDTLIFQATAGNFISKLGIAHGSYLELDSLSFISDGKLVLLPNGNFDNWVLHRKN